MKKLFALLLSVLMCFCLAGCDSLFVKHVPPSYQPVAIYYGVAQTIEESDGLFVYIPEIGVCDIPSYDEQMDIEEGDVLIMEFNTEEVQIMERYPAKFAIPAYSIRTVEFSFSLTWGIFGHSSYDSKTGRLVKTDDVGNKEEYETTHFLTAKEEATIFKIIEDLYIYGYPDEYNPTAGIGSDPYQTLILSVNREPDYRPKTVTASEVALDEATSPEGKRFMDACKKIADILENTNEWKALPDYPYLYA